MGRFFVLIVNDAENYIKYLAWLVSKPKDQDKTRAELYAESDIVNEEPEKHCYWLVEYALNCGLYSSGAGGMTPLSWTDVKDWQQVNGIKWKWLAREIMRLSREYVRFYYDADDANNIQSPLDKHKSLEATRLLVRQQFKAMIQADRELESG